VKKSGRPSLRLDRAAVVAGRLAAHHLHRRLPAGGLRQAAAMANPDNPPGGGALSLAARVEGVTPDAVAAALVATWSLRGAVHLVAETDLAVFTLGSLPVSDDPKSWQTFLGGFGAELAEQGGEGAEAVEAVRREVVALLGRRPMTKVELSEGLHGRLPTGLEPWCAGCRAHHVSEQALRAAAMGQAVFEAPGTTPRLVRRKVDGDPRRARRELVRRFFRAYGPAGPEELANFLSVSPAEARRSIDDLPDRLVPVEVDGRHCLLRAADVEAFTAPPRAEGVRLLPPNDPFLQQRDRAVVAPDEAVRRRLWRPLHGPGLVLAEGRTVALWRGRKQGRRLAVTLEPLGRLARATLRAVEEEATALAPLRGCPEATVEVGSP